VLANEVFLPIPIITLTGLWVTEETAPVEADKFDPEDYYFSLPNASHRARIDTLGTFGPYPFRLNMFLEGTFGYEVEDETSPPSGIPENVRRATVLLAAAWSVEKRLESVALDGSRAEVLDTGIPREVFDLIKRFRIRNDEI